MMGQLAGPTWPVNLVNGINLKQINIKFYPSITLYIY